MGGGWFCGSMDEFGAVHEKLKLTPCPHCRIAGTLILHGFLRGYDETSPRQKAVRARRVFCSNRKARSGCGRTFSVWLADKIRRLSLSAGGLWKFLKAAVAGGNKLNAIRNLKCQLSDSALYRVWKRFSNAQATIRTALFERCRPPEVSADDSSAGTIAHLEAAFPDTPNPIRAFQQTLRTFFL